MRVACRCPGFTGPAPTVGADCSSSRHACFWIGAATLYTCVLHHTDRCGCSTRLPCRHRPFLESSALVRSANPLASTVPGGAVTRRPSRLTPIFARVRARNSGWPCSKHGNQCCTLRTQWRDCSAYSAVGLQSVMQAPCKVSSSSAEQRPHAGHAKAKRLGCSHSKHDRSCCTAPKYHCHPTLVRCQIC